MGSIPPLFQADGIVAHEATLDDGLALDTLFEGCADFFDLTTGLPPGPAEVQSLFLALPAGKRYHDKWVISLIGRTGDLIGVMDVVRDYPDPETWWVGLMLLHPEQRGRGVGARIFRSFMHWAASHGAERVCLAVKEQNEMAYRFWRRMGFEVVDTRPPKRLGAKLSVVKVMQRETAAAAVDSP
jgi:GNAT superfamily N-acetyltransferase